MCATRSLPPLLTLIAGVAEGYTSPSASPLTQSPSKPHHTTPVAFVPTANQILHSVYGGSPTASRTAPSPSPSPRKRVREDERAGRDMDAMDCSDDGCDSSDDEDVLITPTVAGGGFPNVCSTARPVRPLRRSRFPQPSFATTAQQSSVVAAVPDIAMDYLPANILHHTMAIPVAPAVTVGGGDHFGGQALRV